MRRVFVGLLTISLLLCMSRPLLAQSAEELAKQTQNPVASLISVPFQGNWDFGIGDREATGTTLNIQPVAPFGLTKEWNVILRVIMPVASQPTDSGGQRLTGMGDTTMTVFFSPAKTGKVIWGAGPAILIPTATSQGLGTEKFGSRSLGRGAGAAWQVDGRRAVESDLVDGWRQRSSRCQRDVPAAVRELQSRTRAWPSARPWRHPPTGKPTTNSGRPTCFSRSAR